MRDRGWARTGLVREVNLEAHVRRKEKSTLAIQTIVDPGYWERSVYGK